MARWLLNSPGHPHLDYMPPPPWHPRQYDILIKPLPLKKTLLPQRELHREAMERVADVEAAAYYTDGSTHHLTGAVGAAFVTKGSKAVFRLPGGSSSTQVRLVVILRAPLHAKKSATGPVVHTDSMSALQAIARQRCNDNTHLLTSTWQTLEDLAASDKRAAPSWHPSHSAIEGNEAATKGGTLLPGVTVPLPPSTHPLAPCFGAQGLSIQSQLQGSVADNSPSSCWYSAALNSERQHLQKRYPRTISVLLHRLRLGYKCVPSLTLMAS